MRSKIVKSLPSVTPFVPPEALERQQGKPFELRLGANESAFGPSPAAKKAIARNLDQIWKYGDASQHDLHQAIANHLGIPTNCIVAGPGIDGILGHLARILIDPGQTAVTSLGGYPTLEYAVRGVGGEIHHVPYLLTGPDLINLAKAAQDQNAAIVYLANPDNPSGAWATNEAIDEFIRDVPKETAIILDEAYTEFAPTRPEANAYLDDPRVIRLRTFSKAHGMAGMRVAYAFGHPETVNLLHRIRMHFEIGILSQKAAIASLEDLTHLNWVVEETKKGRAEYANLGLESIPSGTNFVALDLGTNERATATIKALADRGVFVRMPWAAPLNQFIRVSVGLEEHRARFTEIFRSIRAQ